MIPERAIEAICREEWMVGWYADLIRNVPRPQVCARHEAEPSLESPEPGQPRARWRASAEEITGMTSNSIRSDQLDIHLSSNAESSHSIT